jgi:hypothetical protein
MAALATLLLSASCAGNSVNDGQIKIGAPPGVSLILADYVAAGMGTVKGATLALDVISLLDCCSANTEMALSSLSLDAALLCPDAAEALISSDDRYVIVGPCVANSAILVVRGDPSSARTIGISQNHLYQNDIVSALLGPAAETVPMEATALSYAYDKGEVDGVVIDIEEALQLTGTMLCVGGNKGDFITYDLVARKDLPGLGRLTDAFAAAATALNNPANLQAAIASYGQFPASAGEAEEWIQENVRFLAPA